MSSVRVDVVDAALDMADDDDGAIASALCWLIDRSPSSTGWDWTSSDEDDCERASVIESTGAWWIVSDGIDGPQAYRYGTREDAREHLREIKANARRDA